MEDILQKRVGFGPRFGAYVIDVVFIIIIMVVMAFAFGAMGGAVGADTGASVNYMNDMVGEDVYDDAFYGWDDPEAEAVAGGIMGMVMGALLGVVIGTLGYVLIEAFTGASLGKMILGLKAGTLDGKRGSTGLYMGRAALKYSSIFPMLIAVIIPASMAVMNIISNILSLIVFIGCFFVFRQSKQSLHDQIAKTAIYYKKDLS